MRARPSTCVVTKDDLYRIRITGIGNEVIWRCTNLDHKNVIEKYAEAYFYAFSTVKSKKLSSRILRNKKFDFSQEEGQIFRHFRLFYPISKFLGLVIKKPEIEIKGQIRNRNNFE